MAASAFSRDAALSLQIDRLAVDLFQAEAAYIGAQPSLFRELPAVECDRYRRRALKAVVEGIGWIESRARERAIRQVVVERELYDDFSEDAARVIEQCLSELPDVLEQHLLHLAESRR